MELFHSRLYRVVASSLRTTPATAAGACLSTPALEDWAASPIFGDNTTPTTMTPPRSSSSPPSSAPSRNATAAACSDEMTTPPNPPIVDDIEDLHRTALLRGETTYLDPATGFTVFTELAHLRRGKCCGSACRHCPFGWSNVKTTSAGGTALGRDAKLRSGDTDAARRLLDRIQRDAAAHAARGCGAEVLERPFVSAGVVGADVDVVVESASSPPPSPTTPAAPTSTSAAGRGGRRGGRLTSKNVPYTRTGDKGTSQLLTGERRSKDDDAFEAMGTVDELCAAVGTVHAELTASVENEGTYGDLPEQLLDVMSRLFDVGSHVAKPQRVSKEGGEEEDGPVAEFTADGVGGGFDPQHIDDLEDHIDEMTEALPELSAFILPTGGRAAAQLHVARTVCRRSERRVVGLVASGVCDPNALRYLNRLSDFFFAAARWTNHCEERDEIQYRRPQRGAKQRDRIAVSLQKK